MRLRPTLSWRARATRPLISTEAAHILLALLLYLALTLGPLLGLGGELVRRILAGEVAIGLQPRTWTLLGNSLKLAGLVSGLAAVLGLGLALWLVSGRGRWRRLVRRTFVTPLLIPPYLFALTWLALLSRQGILNRGLEALLGVTISPYGFASTALILSLVFFPVVALLVLAALDGIGPGLVEAARVLTEDRRVWPRIVLPLALPALLGGAGLVFALTLVEYGVPALMQFNVYAIEIYAEFSQSGDPVQAMALAVPLLVPALLLIVASLSGWRQLPLHPRPGGGEVLAGLPAPSSLRFWSRAATAVLAVGVLIPVAVLLVQSGWGRAVWPAAGTARQEMGLSLGLALATALLATLLALPAAHSLSRKRPGWLWALYALPLAVPAPLLGVGLIHLWNRPWGSAVYGHPAILLLAHVGRFLPLAVFVLVVQLRRTDPQLHEAARLHPVGWHRRAARVHLPLLAPGLLASATIVFVLSLGELGASLLVVPPGSATLSLRLFNLLHYGASESVAGLALLVLLVVKLAGGLALVLTRRRDA